MGSEGETHRADLHLQICQAEQLRRQYGNQSMYVEAESQRKLIRRLKKGIQLSMTEEQFRDKWTLTINHVQTSNQVHWRDFDLIWSSRFKEFEAKEKELLDSVKQKYRNRSHNLTQVMESRIRFPKWSRKLLELRKHQYLLGKTQRYLEANNTKRQAEQLEADERVALLKGIEKEMKLKTVRLQNIYEREVQICLDKMALEKQCLVESKHQMAERLRRQCQHAIDEVKRQARISTQQRRRVAQ
jgi:hypothetical protein